MCYITGYAPIPINTAYHVRTHIAKSLQKRCQAIRTAVKSYNVAAKALDPPRPELDWDKVSHFSFLEEFTLLQDTSNAILEKTWARPLVRETMRTARRIESAEVEIQNVHREARRVHTSIRDEELLFSTVLATLKEDSDIIHGAVNDYCTRRRANNAHVLAHLRRLFALQGFTGDPTPGKHAGPPRERVTASPSPMDVDSHGPPSQVVLQPATPSSSASSTEPRPQHVSIAMEKLVTIEEEMVAVDDSDDLVGVDEEGGAAISDLVEHMSSVAHVM